MASYYNSKGTAVGSITFPIVTTINNLAGTGSVGSSGDNGPATSALFWSQNTVSVDSAGNVFVADTNNCRIRFICNTTGVYYGVSTTAGNIYTIAGTGATGVGTDNISPTSSLVSNPYGVFVDSTDNVFITYTSSYKIRFISKNGGVYYGVSTTAGRIYTIAGTGSYGDSGDNGAPTSATFSSPIGICVDSLGNVSILDSFTYKVRFICNVTGVYCGIPATAGRIYTVAGSGTPGYAGDGGPATNAAFIFLHGIYADSIGNIIIGDTNNKRVRLVSNKTGVYYGVSTTVGNIYTIAGTGISGSTGDGGLPTNATLNNPDGIYVDSLGNIFIADILNNKIRFICNVTGIYYGVTTTTGNIYTIAGTGEKGATGDGGLPINAKFNSPTEAVIDPNTGKMNIVDSNNNKIRVITPQKYLYNNSLLTLAGSGTSAGATGDNGSATASLLNNTSYIFADSSGNVFLSDTNNNKIRFIPKYSGKYYGVTTTAGNIYTIVGTGSPGTPTAANGDNGAPTNALLNSPLGICLDSNNNLYIVQNYKVYILPYSTTIAKSRPYNISGVGAAFSTPNSGYYYQGVDVALYSPSV